MGLDAEIVQADLPGDACREGVQESTDAGDGAPDEQEIDPLAGGHAGLIGREAGRVKAYTADQCVIF
ncbi:MAG: hypothetical protein ACFHWZ_15085 [Phycisphaerales bacterium]